MIAITPSLPSSTFDRVGLVVCAIVVLVIGLFAFGVLRGRK